MGVFDTSFRFAKIIGLGLAVFYSSTADAIEYWEFVCKGNIPNVTNIQFTAVGDSIRQSETGTSCNGCIPLSVFDTTRNIGLTVLNPVSLDPLASFPPGTVIALSGSLETSIDIGWDGNSFIPIKDLMLDADSDNGNFLFINYEYETLTPGSKHQSYVLVADAGFFPEGGFTGYCKAYHKEAHSCKGPDNLKYFTGLNSPARDAKVFCNGTKFYSCNETPGVASYATPLANGKTVPGTHVVCGPNGFQ